MLSLRLNLGGLERTIRIALGLAALALPLAVPIERHWALALVLFAPAALVTGLAGWCPLYELFGLSSRRR